MTSKLIAGRTFDFVLADYRGEPDADVFKLRVLSGDQQTEFIELHRAALNETDAKKRDEMSEQLLALAIATKPFDGRVMSVLTASECAEIISASLQGASLTRDERKKFVLRPLSASDSSATTAEASATSASPTT